jgi:hypothetical protein
MAIPASQPTPLPAIGTVRPLSPGAAPVSRFDFNGRNGGIGGFPVDNLQEGS